MDVILLPNGGVAGVSPGVDIHEEAIKLGGVVVENYKPTLNKEELIQIFTNALQLYLDQSAQERRYDNILSLCTYATDPDPKLSAEGQAGVLFRSKVWRYGFSLEEGVLSGEKEMPSIEELISNAPKLEWP